MILEAAAYLFGACVTVAVIFQFALAMGAPWGEFAMGGRFPGKFSPGLRVAALLQALVLVLLGLIVFASAGIGPTYLRGLPQNAIWVVVAVSAVSFLMNAFTPSKKERALWAPVTFILLACALVVALD